MATVRTAAQDGDDQEPLQVRSYGGPATQPAWPSRDLVFDSVKARAEEQFGLIDALDGKATFTLGAASVITGGVGTLITGLAVFTGKEAKEMKYLNIGIGNPSAKEASIAAVIVVFAAYLYVVITTYKAYNLRRFAIVPEPRRLAENLLTAPEEASKDVIIESLVNAFEKNKVQIENKTKWTRRSLHGIAVEAALTLVVGGLQLWMV